MKKETLNMEGHEIPMLIWKMKKMWTVEFYEDLTGKNNPKNPSHIIILLINSNLELRINKNINLS